MNVVLIVSDTFRRDHVGAYGGECLGRPIQTPTLDALAAESVVFDRAYSGSFPTLPCRAELFTGKFIFPYLNWGPLPQNEVLLSETFAAAGYTCAMVTDNLPLCRPKYGYDRGFHARHRIRGQWYDNFQPPEREFEWPCTPEKLRDSKDGRIKQYLRNTSVRTSEESYFAPQVVNESIRWLEKNHSQGPFFLYMDMFDPHEPWDPPKEYTELYDPGGTGENVIYPNYAKADTYPENDLRRIRALYGGEVTLVDKWLGKFMEALDAVGRREDTVVAFMSDHGIYLGEHGLIGKMGGKADNLKGWPTYSEVARVPFMVRGLGLEPRRTEAFAHPGDLSPTLLELAGVKVPDTMKTRSLVPVLYGKTDKTRDVAVSSWSLRGWSAFRPSVIRNDEWALVFWRSGIEPELYHLPSDPTERQNVYAGNEVEAREMHRRYVEFLRETETPLKHLVPRMWLMRWGKTEKQSLMMPD